MDWDIEELLEEKDGKIAHLEEQLKDCKKVLKNLDYWLGQELKLNCFNGEIMSIIITKPNIMEEQKKKIEEVLKKVEK